MGHVANVVTGSDWIAVGCVCVCVEREREREREREGKRGYFKSFILMFDVHVVVNSIHELDMCMTCKSKS